MVVDSENIKVINNSQTSFFDMAAIPVNKVYSEWDYVITEESSGSLIQSYQYNKMIECFIHHCSILPIIIDLNINNCDANKGRAYWVKAQFLYQYYALPNIKLYKIVCMFYKTI